MSRRIIINIITILTVSARVILKRKILRKLLGNSG